MKKFPWDFGLLATEDAHMGSNEPVWGKTFQQHCKIHTAMTRAYECGRGILCVCAHVLVVGSVALFFIGVFAIEIGKSICTLRIKTP